tara:strand:+ start:4509 stop:5447 length:939 start_codon:yes stop_codon:yes gene_type:complete
MTDTFNHIKLFSFNREFNFLKKLYTNNKLPNKILFSGYKSSGKSTFVYHFINYIFSIKEEFKYDSKKMKINVNNKSFKLVSSLTHPNFYKISLSENKNFIEILQIRETLHYLKKTSFLDLPKIVLIDDCECLNKSSSNSLLKVLEEPPENTFFFLVHNSQKAILDTIKSRCIQINLFMNKLSRKELISYLTDNKYENINFDFKNDYLKPKFYVDYINYCERNNLSLEDTDIKNLFNNIFKNQDYKKDIFIKKYFFLLVQLFFYNNLINNINKDNSNHELFLYFVKRFNDIKKYNLDFESFVIEFKNKAFDEK